MKTCDFPYCTADARSKNSELCLAHYAQKRKGVELRPVQTYHPNRPGSPCILEGCEKPVLSRGLCGGHYRRKNTYNLTVDQLQEIQDTQTCDLCGGPPTAAGFHIDHDWKCCPTAVGICGKCVRGVLCSRCNTGIGMFKDDVTILRSAIEYLSR